MKAGSRFSQSYLSSIPDFLHGIPETILLCLIEFHFQRWSGLQNGLLDRRPLGCESSEAASYSPLAASCQVSWLVVQGECVPSSWGLLQSQLLVAKLPGKVSTDNRVKPTRQTVFNLWNAAWKWKWPDLPPFSPPRNFVRLHLAPRVWLRPKSSPAPLKSSSHQGSDPKSKPTPKKVSSRTIDTQCFSHFYKKKVTVHPSSRKPSLKTKTGFCEQNHQLPRCRWGSWGLNLLNRQGMRKGGCSTQNHRGLDKALVSAADAIRL